MCGIVGCWNREDAYSIVLSSLKSLKNRGKHGCGICVNKTCFYRNSPFELPLNSSLLSPNAKSSKSALGHVLHAMVDHVQQPLVDKGIFAFNGEIYNWREIAQEYNIHAKNDTQLLFQLLERCSLSEINSLSRILEKLDGVYAFVYQRDSYVIVSRDLFGVKPLFYSINSNTLLVGSESKLFDTYKEVPPGTSIKISLNNYSIEYDSIPLELPTLSEDSHVTAKKKIWELLKEAVKKRIPENKKIGVLFSGGIDSTIIALILKELNVDFTCYTAKLLGGNIEEAQDLVFAKEIAQLYNLDLSISQISVNELEEITSRVMELIEDCDYIKTSVALPFYLSSKKAQEEGVEVLFSGVGAEEIFAGYRRHKNVEWDKINEECLEGLKIIHKRDLFRDDVISMDGSIEMRVPFLDKYLVEYGLSLPPHFKLSTDKIHSKLILREASKTFLHLEDRYVFRQKKAAQYGSKFDKGLLRLAKNKNLSKQDYLNQLWDRTIGKKRPEKVWYL